MNSIAIAIRVAHAHLLMLVPVPCDSIHQTPTHAIISDAMYSLTSSSSTSAPVPETSAHPSPPRKDPPLFSTA